VLRAFMGAMILVGSFLLVFGMGIALDENVSIFNIFTFSSDPILYFGLPTRRSQDGTPSKEITTGIRLGEQTVYAESNRRLQETLKNNLID